MPVSHGTYVHAFQLFQVCSHGFMCCLETNAGVTPNDSLVSDTDMSSAK